MTQQLTAPSQLEACLVNTIIAATTDILASATQTTVVFKEARASRAFLPYGNMLATVSFATEVGEGMAAISFPESLGNTVVGRLLQLPSNQLTYDDQCDGIGELVSMVSGEAKSRLSAMTGSKYNLALPYVAMHGSPEIPARLRHIPVLWIVFEAENEMFSVQIAYNDL